MKLQVKGRNVDVTDSLFSHAERKLGKLAKLLSDETRCELELAVEHNPAITERQGSSGYLMSALTASGARKVWGGPC